MPTPVANINSGESFHVFKVVHVGIFLLAQVRPFALEKPAAGARDRDQPRGSRDRGPLEHHADPLHRVYHRAGRQAVESDVRVDARR